MKVLVTGATSMIGDFLLPVLVKAGVDVVATSRKEHVHQGGVEWLCVDMNSDAWMHGVGEIDCWINFASLSLLVPLVASAAKQMKVKRIIAFSSTSRFTKIDARGEHDRSLAQMLETGELELEKYCGEYGVNWTVIRPTLIYCLGRDKNLTLISDKIRQFRLFPLLGSGEALRQPVHAEDLARACVQIMNADVTANKAYNLSGAEIISYRSMVERLFERLNVQPRFIRIPCMFLRIVIHLLRLLPIYRYLTPDMADRMGMDMVFSHDEASRDFGYKPRPFDP